MKNLLIIGAGGHGKVVADVVQSLAIYEKIEFLDDNCKANIGFSILGPVAHVKQYIHKFDVFVAIGNNKMRGDFLKSLIELGANIPTFVHPSAVVSKRASIGIGSIVMPGAVVNAGASLGKGCIVNTCASIDHDCLIEDYCHISVGAHLAGNVYLGEKVWVGIGALVNNNIGICSNTCIGAGAVVVKNIAEPAIYIGIPAKKMIK